MSVVPNRSSLLQIIALGTLVSFGVAPGSPGCRSANGLRPGCSRQYV
jgi:hypothetical protein